MKSGKKHDSHFSILLFYFVISWVFSISFQCPAQDLEPRRWSHLPVDANFAGLGYSFTRADIYFDPVLRAENVEMEMHAWTAKYIRTFELFEKSARIDLIQSFQDARWTGSLNGFSTSTRRNGLADTMVRFAVNLYGAPPLKGKSFQEYRMKALSRAETIIGAALVVHLPTGDYMSDKLINLGSNRYAFRPQFGVVHNHGKWSMEVTGDVWLYSDNDDFYNGGKLEQDPMFLLQTHLVYAFRPKLSFTASGGYYFGGASTINRVEKDDRKKNLAWGLSCDYSVSKKLGIKIIYLGTRTQTSIGSKTHSGALALSYYW